MQGFWLEWQSIQQLLHNKKIVSVYFGGGTPALIGPSSIQKILSWVQPHESAEITLEANPENVNFVLMKDFKSAGINRVSLGAQAFNDDLLIGLGRTHNASKTEQCVEDTYRSGINNISIDLMYDIPGQTLQKWQITLAKAAKLPITHLSLYNLTFEPNTLFYKRQNLLQKSVPDAEMSLQMYNLAKSELEAAQLMQYEISAFARNDLKSRHNLGYWTGRPFLGLGPSAFSFWEGKRFRNVAHLGKYFNKLNEGSSPVDFEEKLEDKASRRELLAIHLRLKEGVNLIQFEKQHGPLDQELFEILKNLESESYILCEAHNVRLSPKGVLFYDTVASEIIVA